MTQSKDEKRKKKQFMKSPPPTYDAKTNSIELEVWVIYCLGKFPNKNFENHVFIRVLPKIN